MRGSRLLTVNKIVKSKRLRPQNGKRLRELREQAGLRQAAFADEVNAHMRQLMSNVPTAEMLTQSMVSDLELGNADLGILHLFALSDFFSVPPAELLVEDLQPIRTGEVNICSGSSKRQCADGTSHPFLCELGEKRFFISPTFPSDFFISGKCVDCYDRNADANKEHVEFYPLDAFVAYLFSPLGRDDRGAKLKVLGRMQKYFSSSIFRRLYFLPTHQSMRVKEPCMSIDPGSGVVTVLFPSYMGDFTHLEMHNREVSAALYAHYHQGSDLVHDTLSLLDIAQRTLMMEHAGEGLSSIRYFYRQCVMRTRCADQVKSCFTPEIQRALSDINYEQ